MSHLETCIQDFRQRLHQFAENNDRHPDESVLKKFTLRILKGTTAWASFRRNNLHTILDFHILSKLFFQHISRLDIVCRPIFIWLTCHKCYRLLAVDFLQRHQALTIWSRLSERWFGTFHWLRWNGRSKFFSKGQYWKLRFQASASHLF